MADLRETGEREIENLKEMIERMKSAQNQVNITIVCVCVCVCMHACLCVSIVVIQLHACA